MKKEYKNDCLEFVESFFDHSREKLPFPSKEQENSVPRLEEDENEILHLALPSNHTQAQYQQTQPILKSQSNIDPDFLLNESTFVAENQLELLEEKQNDSLISQRDSSAEQYHQKVDQLTRQLKVVQQKLEQERKEHALALDYLEREKEFLINSLPNIDENDIPIPFSEEITDLNQLDETKTDGHTTQNQIQEQAKLKSKLKEVSSELETVQSRLQREQEEHLALLGFLKQETNIDEHSSISEEELITYFKQQQYALKESVANSEKIRQEVEKQKHQISVQKEDLQQQIQAHQHWLEKENIFLHSKWREAQTNLEQERKKVIHEHEVLQHEFNALSAQKENLENSISEKRIEWRKREEELVQQLILAKKNTKGQRELYVKAQLELNEKTKFKEMEIAYLNDQLILTQNLLKEERTRIEKVQEAEQSAHIEQERIRKQMQDLQENLQSARREQKRIEEKMTRDLLLKSTEIKSVQDRFNLLEHRHELLQQQYIRKEEKVDLLQREMMDLQEQIREKEQEHQTMIVFLKAELTKAQQVAEENQKEFTKLQSTTQKSKEEEVSTLKEKLRSTQAQLEKTRFENKRLHRDFIRQQLVKSEGGEITPIAKAYYVLGLEKEANRKEIDHQKNLLLKLCHPDKNMEKIKENQELQEIANHLTRMIHEAYQLLR